MKKKGMNWYNFIFSERKWYRVRRHLSFWLLWWLYFSVSFFHFEQSGLKHIEFESWNLPFFIKSVLLLSIHVAACYYFINYLLPSYLIKSKYLTLIIHILMLCFFILIASYFIYKEIVPIVNAAFHYKPTHANQNIWWTSLTAGLLSAPKVIAAAAAIKLLKRWWLKQKEKEKLEKEKLITELQLLKGQIHPEFLFSSLNNIDILVQKKCSEKASVLLLKLADILSYTLYECDKMFVSLENEIKAIKDYILLEKTTMGNRLEIDVAEKGHIQNQTIAPLILLPFIENSFSYIHSVKLEQTWINLELLVTDATFVMRLIHGKTVDGESKLSKEDIISRTVKRLDYFYPGNYELKTTVEPEMMMTYLKIKLDESESNHESIRSEQLIYAAI